MFLYIFLEGADVFFFLLPLLKVVKLLLFFVILSINSEMKLTYLSYRVMRLLTVHCRSGETGLIAHLLVTNEGSVPGQGREKSSSSCSFYAKQFAIGKAKYDHS